MYYDTIQVILHCVCLQGPKGIKGMMGDQGPKGLVGPMVKFSFLSSIICFSIKFCTIRVLKAKKVTQEKLVLLEKLVKR